MSQLNERHLAELERFARLPEGAIVKEWLRIRLATYDQQLRDASGEDILRCQGKARALSALIDDLEKAAQRRERAQASSRSVVSNYRADEEPLRA